MIVAWLSKRQFNLHVTSSNQYVLLKSELSSSTSRTVAEAVWSSLVMQKVGNNVDEIAKQDETKQPIQRNDKQHQTILGTF